MKKILLSFTLIPLCTNMFGNDTIIIKNNLFGIDKSKKMVVVNQNINEINTQWLQEKDAIYLNELYKIEPSATNVQTGIGYQITNTQGDTYTLYFSQLPLVFLTVTDSIVYESKVPAKFTIIESNSNTVASDISIRIRGGSTRFLFSKKSYKIVFKTDASLQNNKDVRLLGMRSDNDWHLHAMPNEPLRMNEKTSFDIWRKINTLYYQSSEREAINSCRMKYAELFLNGEYQGVYCVSEPVDRKQLKLIKYDTKNGIRGELYKSSGWGPTTFTSCPPYNNNSLWWVNNSGYGYESIYPNEVNPDWKNLYDFVYFVMYSSDENFYSQYQNYFNADNAIDYFIFMNLSRAEDNTGNNLFVAKYDKAGPYFYVPWDVDGTFGNGWDGIKRDITNDILSNGFYDRLMKDHVDNNFKQRLKTKWNQLKKDWLTVQNLMDLFSENYDYLLQNGVYEREEITWKDSDNYHFDSQYMDYLEQWITKRLEFLDIESNNLVAIQKVEKNNMQCPCDVQIYDTNGQLIKTMYLTNPEDKALYSNLNKGIYIVRIKNPDVEEAKKLIVW